ncbi:PREDICTED: F-box only protein 5 isoform X1 [Ceratotherium simum simum]|uniref:F-box only protein 5 isoform X1 n=2 Tax=Ceratotherium simum simum TaxID=73337 RepID=A0ABM0I5F8_CERSS|nr:PREDICTED: F-box only protein 5 isoform X1 [Ceratotherium simum simum]
MSRSRCSCSPRPPSSSCRCSSSALTAAGRPRPSDSYKEESSTLSGRMKCDFSYNDVHSGLKLVKPDDNGRVVSYTPAYLEGSCKDCIKDYEKLSYLGSPIVSPRTVELEQTESKPLHNKENQHVQQTLSSSNEIEELETNGPYEDSGYSSFSQPGGLNEHGEGSLPLEENFSDSPQSYLLQMQSPDQYPNKNFLPALHFAKLVCSTLKKNAKRNPKIDREKLKEFISSDFRLQNIIGRKMGLEYVDILSELFRRDLRHVLANILTQLNDMDLINVSKVSTTWKKILEDDKGAMQLYNKAIQRVSEKNSKFSPQASTREYVMIRTALASVQKSAAQAPPKKGARTKLSDPGDQKDSTYSRHNEFSEVAKTLKNNESLKACVRCNSPAKYDCYLERATCKREGCGFDYCTRCLCNYHTTKDCSNGKPPKTGYKMGPLPGTKKSKKNLRRL